MDKEEIKNFFNRNVKNRIKWRKRNAYYWNDIVRFYRFTVPKHASVLEVGCAVGDTLASISAKKRVGIDFSAEMIARAKKRHKGIDFHVMDAEDITLNEKFDYIILSNSIGYLNDIQKVFEQLHKVSHRRTKIVITYYNFLWQPILSFAEKVHLRMKQPEQNWLSIYDISNLLYLAGHEVFKSGQRLLIPINIPILAPLINRYVAPLPFLRNLCITNFVIARPFPAKSDKENSYTTSIVIPARNESGNIEDAVRRIPSFGKSIEVIFIEGNSTDDTWEKIQDVCNKYKDRMAIKIAQQDGKGKGDAVRKGFSMASGDILMILDADLTVPPEDLPKFYAAIASGKGEFINGSRLVYNMDKDAMRFLNILGNKFFSVMFTWLLDQRFKDTLCGTKVIFRDDYQHLIEGRKFFGDFDPFGDFDLLFGASKLNLKIVELPIRYRERKYGDTNISRFRHGMVLLRMCLFAAKKIKFL